MSETAERFIGGETEFEKRRGVRRIEIRRGFAQLHVSDLGGDVASERLRVLRTVADAGMSIDFLKLTPTGLSFLVPNPTAGSLDHVLTSAPGKVSITKDRAIILVHAVNIRDEEGLIAMIIQEVIAFGAVVDHVGDMHDRLLIVVGEDHASGLAKHLETVLTGERAVEN